MEPNDPQAQPAPADEATQAPAAPPVAPRTTDAPPAQAVPGTTAAATTGRAGLDPLLEEFARDYLRERKQTRRWNRFLRVSWLLVFVAIAWALLSQAPHSTPPSTPHTALVELRGEISADSEASADFLLSGLKNAFEDQGAQAVVIRINSPGGSPVQAGIINDEIRRLKRKHDKKVYAVVEESCASGAYYVAVAADLIYVDKAAIVGSIGVLMDGFGFTGAMEKFGVERRLLTAGDNKGMLDPFSPINERQRERAQAMLDQLHRQFISVVREGRGKRLKETPETFSGLFWNGEEALKIGLADGLGNLDYVAREVIKAEDIIDYTPKENVAERLAKRFGASIGAGAAKALQGMSGLR